MIMKTTHPADGDTAKRTPLYNVSLLSYIFLHFALAGCSNEIDKVDAPLPTQPTITLIAGLSGDGADTHFTSCPDGHTHP